MKTAKRILSVLLLLVMVFALVACGGSEETTNTNKPGGGQSSVGGEGGGEDDGEDGGGGGGSVWEQTPANMEDFVDQNYIIIQHSPVEEPFGYSQDSLMGSLVADRVVEVQDKYTCTFEFVQVAYNDSFASAVQGLMYAEDGGDIIFSYNNAQLRKTLGTGGDESAMIDMLAVDNIINFWNTDKWGNMTARECMMAGGIFYGVVPALWIDCTPLPYYQIVYNKDLLEQFGATDPQEYWENEEWDRDAMLDVITSCYDDSMGEPIYGISANYNHMVRATYLTTGAPLVIIDKINADGTVDWSHGIASDDAIEAFQWLKNTISANVKYFNAGKADAGLGWNVHEPFVSGQAAMCMTRPSNLFGDIVTSVENFGLTTWAGADANVLSGYYENTYAVAIPIFAKDYNQSAYLIYDLFEGMDGIETYEDVIAYYRETYFETDLDVEMLLREGAELQYSYWPNGVDSIWGFSSSLQTASSVRSLIEKSVNVVDMEIETYMIPNVVQMEKYRQAGYIG